jgi:ribosomal protein L37AE/L43A
MAEHFTKNTVEASHWCPKCQKRTPHRVDKGLVGPCLTCIAKYDAQVVDLEELRRKLRVDVQQSLFGDAT